MNESFPFVLLLTRFSENFILKLEKSHPNIEIRKNNTIPSNICQKHSVKREITKVRE